MPEYYLIQNEELKVKILTKGAELCSVIDIHSNLEFIWQAGEVWKRHAPNLFPVVGSMKDLEYNFEGETYPMKHHGFARDLNFDVLQQSEHSISFVLNETEETLNSYPFKFSFLVTYTLKGRSLKQTFRVINESEREMPVSYGGHPAFNAEPIGDHFIEFEHPETAPRYKLQTPLISRETERVIKGRVIPLHVNSFDSDALVFMDLRSNKVSLKNSKTNYEVQMDFEGWPYLGIWAKPGAPYVCLEPWQGLADLVDHNKEIRDKKGILWVPIQQEIKHSFNMTFTAH